MKDAHKQGLMAGFKSGCVERVGCVYLLRLCDLGHMLHTGCLGQCVHLC